MGRLLVPGKDIQPGKKGAVVAVLHVIGDSIYNKGTKDYQADELSLERIEPRNMRTKDEAPALASEETRVGGVNATADVPRVRSQQLPQSTLMSQGKLINLFIRLFWLIFAAEIDKILRTALLLAIGSFPRAALPISTSNFYCFYIKPSIPLSPVLPSPIPVDIKHSSFKSLSIFL